MLQPQKGRQRCKRPGAAHIPLLEYSHLPPSRFPSPPARSQALAEGFRSCVWVPLPEGWVEHHDPRSSRPYYVNAATGGRAALARSLPASQPASCRPAPHAGRACWPCMLREPS